VPKKNRRSTYEEEPGKPKPTLLLERLSRHRTQTILDVLPKILRDYARDDSIPSEQRIATVSHLIGELNKCISDITQQSPKPPAWKTRDKDVGLSPPEFVALHYKDALARGQLTLASFRTSDFHLYRALQNWKERYGWPPGFELPTKAERNDSLIANYASGSSSKPLAQALENLRRDARLYELARKRFQRVRKS
jgi:hypothetical protein